MRSGHLVFLLEMVVALDDTRVLTSKMTLSSKRSCSSVPVKAHDLDALEYS